MNKKSKENVYELTDEQWAEIEHRRHLHKIEKSKSHTWEEAKKLLKKQLK